MNSKNKEIKRRTATGPGIPSKEGESSEFRKIRLDRQYLGHPFITEGSIFCFPLLDLIQGPIEANNYRIASIAVYKKNGVLYGTISGDEDHLFFMDKKKLIVKVGKVENKRINANSLAIADNSFLYFTATDEKKNTIVLKHDVDTDYTDQYPLDYFGPIDETETIIKGEIFIESCFNSWDKNIYWLSESGKIFKYSVEKENIKAEVKLDKGFSKTFCCDGQGNIFGALYGGEIFKYIISENKFVKTGVTVPSQKGREYLTGIKKMFIKGNIIYGCTSQDSYLFKYDIARNEVFNYGRPDDNFDIRAIVVEGDGRIFGTTGTREKGLGHLFVYGKNGFKDLGNIAGYRPANGWCNEPEIMALGNDGEIFIADGDNRSKLFLYFPKLI